MFLYNLPIVYFIFFTVTANMSYNNISVKYVVVKNCWCKCEILLPNIIVVDETKISTCHNYHLNTNTLDIQVNSTSRQYSILLLNQIFQIFQRLHF